MVRPMWMARQMATRPKIMMFVTLNVILFLAAVGMHGLVINTAPPTGRSAYAVRDDIRTQYLDAWIKARANVKFATGTTQNQQSQRASVNFFQVLFRSLDGSVRFVCSHTLYVCLPLTAVAI